MKIVFTGPESTGKTVLAEWLSEELGYHLVPEIARPYLESRNIIPSYNDVWEIGLLQHWEEVFAEQHYDNVVCDTDLLTIIIWQEDKFGYSDPLIYDRWLSSDVDIYFLSRPDIPWEPDPLRENPFDRDRLYNIHKSKLTNARKPFFEIYGDWENRKNLITEQLNKIQK